MGKKEKIPPPSDGRRLAIYCRRSCVSDGESRGASCQQQYQQCLLAAKALGYEVTDRLTFLEEDGNKGQWYWKDADGRHPGPHRPELTRMMEAVEAGEVDACMAWRTDRYYRDDLVAGYFLRRLRQNSVKCLVKTQDLHIHTASGFQSATTEACANMAYREKISEDVTRDHETKAANGMLPRGPDCLGFRSAGKGTGQVVPILDEIETVRLVFKLYTRGEEGKAPLSACSIAKVLMERGLRTSVGARGHRCKNPDFVHAGSVTRILRNAFYCGSIQHNGVLHPTRLFDVPSTDGSGRTETVVSEETFFEAREILESFDSAARDPRGTLLTGILLCPRCGRKMYRQAKSGDATSVVCSNRSGPSRTCFGGTYRTLHEPQLAAWAREHLAPLLVAEILAMRSLRDGDQTRAELARAQRRLEAMVRTEGDSLAALVGVMDAVQFAAVARRLKDDREVVEERVRALRALVRKEAAAGDDPYDLIAADDGLVRVAMRRAVRWIAVTKRGIVVLTREGAYIGAYLERGDRNAGRGGHRRPKLMPPSVEATREARSWITDDERFLEGARMVNGRWGRTPPDEELLPDCTEGGVE